jgi:hypothetical protein
MVSSEIPSPTFHNTNIDSGWLKTSSPSASHCHIARASFPVILHGDVGALPSKPLLVVIRTGKTAEVVRAWFIMRVDEELVPRVRS